MKLYKKGNLNVVNAVVAFALGLGIMIYVFGVLKNNLNDSDTSTFFSSIISKLTGTTAVIGAVITLAIVGIIFVVLPIIKK